MESTKEVVNHRVKVQMMLTQRDFLKKGLEILQRKQNELDEKYNSLTDQVKEYKMDDYTFNFEPELDQIRRGFSSLLTNIANFKKIADELLEKCESTIQSVEDNKKVLLKRSFEILDQVDFSYKAREFWMNSLQEFEVWMKQKLDENNADITWLAENLDSKLSTFREEQQALDNLTTLSKHQDIIKEEELKIDFQSNEE